MRYIALEHHPNDSRIKISEDGICQTLNQWMGTGGGNVPLVLEIADDCDTEKIFRCESERHGDMSNT